jgi:hypothetical protein
MRTIRPLSSAIAIALLCSAANSFAQTGGVMNFDGGADGTSWNQANNWEHVADPDGVPTSGNPPTPPTGQYTANIGMSGVLLDATMGVQATFRTRVGVTTPGSFTMTGGTLNVGDDITVGQSAMGTMTFDDGEITVVDDFFIDNGGAFGSTFTMNGGTLRMGDRITMGNQGNFVMNGGHIIADDDFYFLGNSTQTINGGLLEQFDKLNNGNATPSGPARLKINGGIIRTNEWTDNPDLNFDDPTRFMSKIEINSTGILQVEQATMPLAEAQGLIANGRFTTTGPQPLTATTVVIPEFFGRSNVTFTQISVVPEPATSVVAGVGAVAILAWRRKK